MLILKRRKRTVGKRAGMTRPKIVAAGANLWLKVGPRRFTVAALAKELWVSTTTIHAHFRGGFDEIRTEIARSFVDQLAPPYKPNQDAEGYLRALFQSAIETLHKGHVAGHLVASTLADDPLMSPIFAERLLTTVAGLAKDHDRAWGLQLVVERLAAMILFETGSLALKPPVDAKASVLKRISALPSSEFSMLKQSAAALAAEPQKRADPQYSKRIADHAVDTILAEFAKGQPQP